MPKNKDPAVLFYTSDFLADTTLWNYEELGRYIKLLCIQHLQGGISEDDFTDVADGRKRVIEKFVKGEDGKYRNHRMEEEVANRARFSTKQQSNGSKGGRPKNPNKTQTKPKQNPNETQTKAKRNPNESPRVENENENINNTNSFSFSDNTNKQTNKKKLYKENLTDAELNEYALFRTKVIHYFAEHNYQSDPLDFIRYNEERDWIGGYGEDVRQYWMTFAEKWEIAYNNRQCELDAKKGIKDDDEE